MKRKNKDFVDLEEAWAARGANPFPSGTNDDLKGFFPRHPSSERFHQILKEIGELHDAKSIGYGTDADPLSNVRSSEDWGMPAWVGGMVRACDKIKRLQAYAQKGELPFESVEDDLRDIASYAVISLVLFEQEQIKS